MKTLMINLGIATVMALPACKKQDTSSIDASTASAIAAAVQQTQSVAVATSTSTAGDSIYVIGTCDAHGHRDSIAFANLPSAIGTYLSANYSGYTFSKAFSTKDASGTINGYVVIIEFNGNPVGLKFDASGQLVKVLEQREGHDLIGNGFHNGGCFQDRDGRQRDTITLSSLPAAITSYFASYYNTDTLVRASVLHYGGYVVLSKNSQLYATLFSSTGTFVNRIQLPAAPGRGTSIDLNALPAVIQSYLSATYPGYVFNKAFVISINGVVHGYCVVIDSNNTKYALQFDASGNFIRVRLIH